jgi:clan AA aspartic protease
MMLGFVNADYEAKINLIVRGPKQQEQEIEGVVDTGFDGWLTLPATIISSLTLPFRRRGRAVLADGSETVFNSKPVTRSTLHDSRERFTNV